MQMDWQWIGTTLQVAFMIVVSATVVYLAVILYTRLSGLRSFSKMSAFDFIMTIAVGSLVASALVMERPTLLEGLIGVGMLFVLQFVVAFLRPRFLWVRKTVDNDPLLLMIGDEILHENLRSARITEADLKAKLREANVLQYHQVRAVVLETTGDISVLHGEAGGPPLDPDLLSGVTGVDRLRDADADA